MNHAAIATLALFDLFAANGAHTFVVSSRAFSLSRSPPLGSARTRSRCGALRCRWPDMSTKRYVSVTVTSALASESADSVGLQYWLLKSEESEYSISDMKRDGTEEWDGIRNYQARNHLRSMKVGDRAFFYHSKSSQPGIVGTVTIARTAQPDATAYDPKSEYYDAKSTKDDCRWDSVKVQFEKTFPVVLTLKELKAAASSEPDGPIASLALFKQTRLSVVPLKSEQWQSVMAMIEEKVIDTGEKISNKDSKVASKRRRTEK